MNTPTPKCTAAGGLVCYAQEGVGLVVSAAEHNMICAQLTARAEAAEALNVEFKRAGLAILADPESRHIHLTSLPELRGALSRSPADMGSKLAELEKEQKRLLKVAYDRYAVRLAAFEKDSDALRSHIAEQDAELASARAFGDEEEKRAAAFRAESSAKDAELARLREELEASKWNANDLNVHRNALRARVADLEHDRNISAASADLLADDVKEAQSRMEKAEQRAERLIYIGDQIITEEPHRSLWEQTKQKLADQPEQAKQGTQPVANAALLAVLSPSDLTRTITADKAASCMKRDGSAVTGFVLTAPSGSVGIVNQSAVRWLSEEEFRGVMSDELAALRDDRAFLEFIRTRCKVIHWPEAAYPVEHSLAARKDMWGHLQDAARKSGGVS